jgi:hypothetical protein
MKHISEILPLALKEIVDNANKNKTLPENEKQCFTETQFLNNCHCSFIIQNFNKVKELIF